MRVFVCLWFDVYRWKQLYNLFMKIMQQKNITYLKFQPWQNCKIWFSSQKLVQPHQCLLHNAQRLNWEKNWHSKSPISNCLKSLKISLLNSLLSPKKWSSLISLWGLLMIYIPDTSEPWRRSSFLEWGRLLFSLQIITRLNFFRKQAWMRYVLEMT